MRGEANPQQSLFSDLNLDERVPRSHPLRKRRVLVNGVLVSLDAERDARYARGGRPSIPPEQLLRAALIQILYTLRSERQLVEQLDFNRLFRWFVGLGIDEGVWDHSTFSKHRDRLFAEGLARQCSVGSRLSGIPSSIRSIQVTQAGGMDPWRGLGTRAKSPHFMGA